MSSKAYEKSIVNHLYDSGLCVGINGLLFVVAKKVGFSTPSLSSWKLEDVAKLISVGASTTYLIQYLKKEGIIPPELWK